NAKSCSQLSLSVVQTTTHLVLDQNQVSENIIGGVERRSAGTLVVLTGPENRLDDTVSRNIRRNSNRMGVHSIVPSNRAKLVLIDLVLIVRLTTVTNQDGTSKLLLQHD